MQIKPIKKRFFIRLTLIWALVFLAAFAIILYSINPFEASIASLIIFYAALFCLLLGVLNLIGVFLRIPIWVSILIDLAIIIILLIRSFYI